MTYNPEPIICIGDFFGLERVIWSIFLFTGQAVVLVNGL